MYLTASDCFQNSERPVVHPELASRHDDTSTTGARRAHRLANDSCRLWPAAGRLGSYNCTRQTARWCDAACRWQQHTRSGPAGVRSTHDRHSRPTGCRRGCLCSRRATGTWAVCSAWTNLPFHHTFDDRSKRGGCLSEGNTLPHGGRDTLSSLLMASSRGTVINQRGALTTHRRSRTYFP